MREGHGRAVLRYGTLVAATILYTAAVTKLGIDGTGVRMVVAAPILACHAFAAGKLAPFLASSIKPITTIRNQTN